MNPNRNHCLLCVTLMFACWPAPAQQPPKLTPKIAGGGTDFSGPETDVVVKIASNITCTGTLVTPLAVLTARHCVNGDTSGNPPLQYPVTIYVGNQNGNWVRQYTSSNITPSKTWAAGPQTTGNAGNDIAVIFLDPPGPNASDPKPAWDYPQIVHPSLTSPCPNSGCGDANGGTYSPLLGMAGWAPQDAPVYRQVAYDSEFNHYPGLPDDRGQYWTHVQGSIHDDPGDSGGPLFVRRPDPSRPGSFYRDVIGVLSGVQHNTPGHDYDLWADITRGAIADWVRGALADPIPRGPNWKAAHPNMIWYGDVDYLGGCQSSSDTDCDHIYDYHDNCRNIFNPDQRDTLDNGVGDACRTPPPPPPTAWCSAQWTCFDNYTGAAVISCPLGLQGLTLQRLVNGAFQTITANTTQALNAFVADYGTAPNTVLTYRVLRDSVPGPSMQVTATDCSCHPSNYCGYGGIECGVVPNNCGGTETCGQCATGMACSSNHCCPQGQSWDNIRNICTTKPKQCPVGWGDCGGYCCKCTKETCS